MLGAIIGGVGLATSIVGGIGASKSAKNEARIKGMIAQEQMKLGRIQGQQIDLQRQQTQIGEQAFDTQYATSQQLFGLEQQAEGVRRQAMEFDANRRALENIRQFQRARAASVAVANAQGAIGGSGLNSAVGQASGQTAFNMEGVVQGLQQGRTLFDINAQTSSAKQTLAATLYGLTKQNYQFTYQGFDLAKQGNVINQNINQLNSQLSGQQSQTSQWSGIASIGSSIFSSANTLGNIFAGFGSSSSPTAMSHTGFGPGSGY